MKGNTCYKFDVSEEQFAEDEIAHLNKRKFSFV